MVFYAVPTDAPADPAIRLLAEDAAGNVGKARWPVVLNERALPRANVTLPRRFLDEKVVPLARAERIEAPDVQQAFHRINTEVRQRNEQQIRRSWPTRRRSGSGRVPSSSCATRR